MGVYIPNMDKPKSCGECRILRAEFYGSYDKPITGCRQKMGKKSTLREEWDALLPDCPLIDIVRCGECEYKRKYALRSDEPTGIWCHRWSVPRLVTEDDFCSYGERRSDDKTEESRP